MMAATIIQKMRSKLEIHKRALKCCNLKSASRRNILEKLRHKSVGVPLSLPHLSSDKIHALSLSKNTIKPSKMLQV
jgi:hypothetical protein